MYAFCEDCEYRTEDFETERETVGEVGIDGGYIMSDKNGGCYTKCPQCDQDTLMIYD